MVLGLGIGALALAGVAWRQSRRLAQVERELEAYRREVMKMDKALTRSNIFRWLRPKRG